MAFTVLSDNNVKQLFQSFGPEDVARMADVLTDAFLAYSVGPEAQYQPHRAAVLRPDGTTGLFMPATMEGGMSVKIVGLPPPTSATSDLRCVLTICDGTGRAVGIINAEELTAFRTSLGSILLYRYRKATANIVVFGAGKQALWHLRLALVLRGQDIRTITIVNRSKERPAQLVARLQAMGKASGVGDTDAVTFTIIEADPDSAPGHAQLRSAVEESDVIFCTTPSTQRVFPAEWLTLERGAAKTRYIAAIGSYKLNMKELDPDFLRAVVDTPLGAFTSAARGGAAKKTGVIFVDSREACFLEAGELVEAKIPADKITEVGEFTDALRRADETEAGLLREWLEKGLIVYKSVGIGIMDLSLGKVLLELAAKHQVGTILQEF
ncbi:shikimate/quinate 5-dehydrogenase [Colletotrichum orchidophilum]|uniref:Shikimate/quinate 5-dehydrogenase n=1 Tax=Colletotrichum orchidophilum TaxID=1209926 RepID=A0A1G4B646_9PEZI|nr:shikimate/quinate 5-dehydrogenase [Colletotrichum orchidophilum]OHE96919.1 shikimate/quinate 5-dehydrogenase [Colletotrichum orchidophilum]